MATALAAAFLMLALLCGCEKTAHTTDEGYSLLKEGRLIAVATLDDPPYEHLSGSDPDGFGVAVLRELAARMGLELELKRIDAPNHHEGQVQSLDMLVAADADVALGSFVKGTIDSSDVDYTLPYYEVNYDVVALPDTYGSLEELAETANLDASGSENSDAKKERLTAVPAAVAVVAGSSAQEFAQTIDGVEVRAMRDASACRHALEAGEVRAVVLDSVQAGNVGLAQPDFSLVQRIMVSERFVLAVSRIDVGLANAISRELESMRSDGTLARLESEHLR